MLAEELGPDWRLQFATFDEHPFASASIGQVHRATLSSAPEREVVVKVQFPGVAQSIDSDLDNLAMLLSASMVLPRGLFLDNTLRVMRQELRAECDYRQEAGHGKRFRQLLSDDARYCVPAISDDLSTSRVLTAELLRGRPLASIAASLPDQATRNLVRDTIVIL